MPMVESSRNDSFYLNVCPLGFLCQGSRESTYTATYLATKVKEMVMEAHNAVKYFVVDAFAESALKGNPAVVCLLEEEREQEWMQGIASEFNLLTCYLTRVPNSKTSTDHSTFRLRWFSSTTETKICGHGTVACAHILFSMGIVKGNKVEFLTQSGAFVAAKVRRGEQHNLPDTDHVHDNGRLEKGQDNNFPVQLHFPLWYPIQLSSLEAGLVPKFLQDLSTDNITKMACEDDLIVELSSSKEVAELQPPLDQIQKWPGRGVAITGIAPHESGFDFFTRVFSPNYGVAEDHVCASIHAALAPYWSKKLGKTNLRAYMASPRGGILELQVDEETETVLIAGKAVTVMEGSLFA